MNRSSRKSYLPLNLRSLLLLRAVNYKKGLMRVYLMTERRLGVGWGAVFCCCCFVFFLSCLFFSSQPKVFSLYPGYLRVSFSRTAGCFSVGRSSAEGRNYEQRSCRSLLRFDLNRKPRTDHFHRDHNSPCLSPQNFT